MATNNFSESEKELFFVEKKKVDNRFSEIENDKYNILNACSAFYGFYKLYGSFLVDYLGDFASEIELQVDIMKTGNSRTKKLNAQSSAYLRLKEALQIINEIKF